MNKKIKIAVNTRFLISDKLEGIGTYTNEVLKRLVNEMPEVDFHFLFDRPFSKEFIYADNVIPHQIGFPARHPFLWYLWFEFSVNNWLTKNKMDLFISPDSFLSLKTSTPSFLIMHDLAFEHFPNHNTFLVRHYYKHFFPKYAEKAEKIFAVSKFTKQDIVQKYKIKEDKIELAYCGVSEFYKPLSFAEKENTKKEIANSKPYYICIGSLNPRKNINKAVEAFNLFKTENKNFEHKLVIVGAKGWKTNQLFEEINTSIYKQDIILTGHLEPKKLSKYLGAADALIFPSLFEGFGIPIVEAYKCQIPVITSNVSSTKEIGNEAAILINPENVKEICSAMVQIQQKEFNFAAFISESQKKLEIYDWNRSSEVIKEEIVKHFL